MAKKKGNIGNLKPVRTKEEARERGRNGGIASGKARRQKKALKACAERVLESDLSGSMKSTVEQITGELADDEDTMLTAVVARVVSEAIKGNMRAAREVREWVCAIDQPDSAEDIPDDPLSASLRELGESL